MARIAVDSDLIAGPVGALDFVVTAQQARAYKPDHRLSLHAYSAIGLTKGQTIHVSMSQFTDLKVCYELGVWSVWIVRAGGAPNPEWPPHVLLPDLSALPQLLMRRYCHVDRR